MNYKDFQEVQRRVAGAGAAKRCAVATPGEIRTRSIRLLRFRPVNGFRPVQRAFETLARRGRRPADPTLPFCNLGPPCEDGRFPR
ncbi:hypothetical protein AB4084_08400, partial [Lysobacter sp. 2RAB21]